MNNIQRILNLLFSGKTVNLKGTDYCIIKTVVGFRFCKKVTYVTNTKTNEKQTVHMIENISLINFIELCSQLHESLIEKMERED